MGTDVKPARRKRARAGWSTVLRRAAGSSGPIAVRVDPGGDTLPRLVLDDRDERRIVLSIQGPYQARRWREP